VSDSQSPLERDLDLDALRSNHERLTANLPEATALICSVKANAYGHGVLTIVRALDELGVRGVATASAPDALALRNAGVRCRILLFGGQPPADLPRLARHGITVTVTNAECVEALADDGAEARAFLKVDSGLGRLGVPVDEAERFVRDTLLPAGIRLDGIYTHLPFHDDAGERWARAGLAAFDELVSRLRTAGIAPPIVQALSSPGIAAGLPLCGNAVCPGRLLYGFIPAVGDSGGWGLRPVLRSLRTAIVHVRRHTADAGIGGSGRHEVHAGDTTAVIGFGRSTGNFADVSARPQVVHRGRRVPVVSVSLEHATLDLGPADAAVGEEVVILGGDGDQAISLAELGEWCHLEPLDALVALDRGAAR
jgi:alanine racemase